MHEHVSPSACRISTAKDSDESDIMYLFITGRRSLCHSHDSPEQLLKIFFRNE